MLTKTQEIKYIDDVDYVIDGLMNNETVESLGLINDLLSNEEFRVFMSESKHLNEIVQMLLEIKVKDTDVCIMALELIFQCFNPYSFANLQDLFDILLVIFDGLFSSREHTFRMEIKKASDILERIPIKWYRNYSGCINLERLIFGLQICAGRGILRCGGFVCSLLKFFPRFELEDGFVVKVLRSRRNYEVLVNYTSYEKNVERLSLNLQFKQALQSLILQEFVKKNTETKKTSMSLEPMEAATSSPGTRAQGYYKDFLKNLIVILINLLDKNCFIDVPISAMEEMYHIVDDMTRCYLAVLFLTFIRECKENEELNISLSDLRSEVRKLISMPSCAMSESAAARLIKLIGG